MYSIGNKQNQVNSCMLAKADGNRWEGLSKVNKLARIHTTSQSIFLYKLNSYWLVFAHTGVFYFHLLTTCLRMSFNIPGSVYWSRLSDMEQSRQERDDPS